MKVMRGDKKDPLRVRLLATYHYLRLDPIGRWLLAIVWMGLGCMSAGVLSLVPIWLDRRAFLTAVGCGDHAVAAT